mmetsp:Transcript_1445/g.2773  ORF Transcript_1445/g.2773 Transcript_1445/m.2773 type:complete len:228 (-) Transcript_1445:249-932(-)
MNLVRIDEEYEERMIAFEMDCNEGKGVPEACHSAGDYFSIVKSDMEKASKLYEANCNNNNHGASCFSLGRMYFNGQNFVTDKEKSKELFKKGCDQKLLHSCHFLATMILGENQKINTDAATKARVESIEMLRKNCLEGSVESCALAGRVLIAPASQSPERDPVKAVEMMKGACAHNDIPSCHNLSVLFKNGDGLVKADPQQFEEYKGLTSMLLKQKKSQFKKVFRNS